MGTPMPTPEPTPAPTPTPPGQFTVTGDCDQHENCVTSKGFPRRYGNRQNCAITPGFGRINVRSFQTEAGYDKMHVNGRSYSGTRGPAGVIPTADIVWESDFSVTRKGWMICTTSL